MAIAAAKGRLIAVIGDEVFLQTIAVSNYLLLYLLFTLGYLCRFPLGRYRRDEQE